MKTFLNILRIVVIIPIFAIIIAICAVGLLINHSQEAETAQKNNEINALKAENQRLKNEPDYLFSQAIDLKNESKIKKSRAAFEELQEKHPTYKPHEVAGYLTQLEDKEREQKEAEAERKRVEAAEKEKKRLQEEQLAAQRQRQLEQIRKEHQKAMEAATKNLVKNTDEVKDIEWFHDRSSPRVNDVNNIQAYIGRQHGNVWLRFRMSYTGANWLFVESVTFKVDGRTHTIAEKRHRRWEGDHARGKIWEWKDMQADYMTWDLIRQIANSKKTIMRYQGRQYKYDREITDTEKQALNNILLAYEAMGGKPPIH